jgi:hypothetical protein
MKLRDIQKLMSLIEYVQPNDSEKLTYLSDPEHFLLLLNRATNKRIEVDDFQVLHPWALAALTALGKTTTTGRIYVHNSRSSAPSQFASALDLTMLYLVTTYMVTLRKAGPSNSARSAHMKISSRSQNKSLNSLSQMHPRLMNLSIMMLMKFKRQFGM